MSPEEESQETDVDPISPCGVFWRELTDRVDNAGTCGWTVTCFAGPLWGEKTIFLAEGRLGLLYFPLGIRAAVISLFLTPPYPSSAKPEREAGQG